MGASAAPTGRRQVLARVAGGALAGGLGALAAACGVARGGTGGNAPAQSPATVRFFYRSPNDLGKQGYEKALERWKVVHPTITIEAETADTATYTPRLQAQLAAGTPPDVGQFDYNEFVDYALDGALLPLDEQMNAAHVRDDEWFPGAAEYSRVNGKHYGLPINGTTTILYYNRELFQKAGVRPPQADGSWRWSDLQAAAIQLTRRTPDDPQNSRWGLVTSFQIAPTIACAVRENGADVVDRVEQPARTTLDQPKAIEALQWLADLKLRHQVVPTADEMKAFGGKDPFMMGQVAMVWGGLSQLGAGGYSQIRNFAWDVVPCPRGPDGRQASLTTSNMEGMIKGTKQQAAAFAVAYYFTGGEGARFRTEIQQLATVHKRTFNEVWLNLEPRVNRQVVVDSAPYTRDLYKGRALTKWLMAVQAPLDKAFGGQAGVSAAAGEAVRAGDAVLAEANARK